MQRIDDWLSTAVRRLYIDADTSYKRRLIHQEAQRRFPGVLRTENRGAQGSVLIVKLEAGEDGSSEFERRLEEMIGFRRVVDAIAESGKPVVGHNVLLDLCQTYEKFYRKLPEEVEDFKKGLHSLFPTIYDTKYMSTKPDTVLFRHFSAPNSTHLNTLSNICNNMPFVEPPITVDPDFPEYMEGSTQNFHEAGFDAYTTGLSFIRMAHMLCSSTTSSSPSKSHRVDLLNPTLTTLFLNKLYMMRSDCPYMNLVGTDDAVDTTNYLHLHSFPATWRSGDVQLRLGRKLGGFFVRFVDQENAVLVLKEPRRVDGEVLRALNAGEGLEGPVDFVVETWGEYEDRIRGTGAGVGADI
ncbi:hypothetical protein HK101_005167 [Irineochytrium annulatum]|nr:hypothetical protein HK101_005167 [Irineochytrium annulatum]